MDNQDLLQQLLGISNGIFISCVLYLAFFALSALNAESKNTISKLFFLTAVCTAAFGFFNLHLQNYINEVSTHVFPAPLFTFAKLVAPLSLIIIINTFSRAVSATTYHAQKLIYKYKYWTYFLYALGFSCMALSLILEDRLSLTLFMSSLSLAFFLGFLFSLSAFRKRKKGKIRILIYAFCTAFASFYTYKIYTDNIDLSPMTLAASHILFSLLAVVFAFITVRYSHGKALHDFELQKQDPRNLGFEINKAIINNELFLEYQPQVCLASNTVCGLEALIRWNHPKHGIIPPDEFIELAEKIGRIDQITLWVIEAAIRDSKILKEQNLPVRISINFSAKNLNKPVIQKLKTSLKEHSVSPEQLGIEMTESVIVGDCDESKLALSSLKKLGIPLSLDDYGTGFSSLSSINQLELTELKIDRSFVTNIVNNELNATIVKSTIEMSKGLNLAVVAEGVEDLETADLLKSLGCDIIQGYGISKSLPLDKLIDWLRTSEFSTNTKA